MGDHRVPAPLPRRAGRDPRPARQSPGRCIRCRWTIYEEITQRWDEPSPPTRKVIVRLRPAGAWRTRSPRPSRCSVSSGSLRAVGPAAAARWRTLVLLLVGLRLDHLDERRGRRREQLPLSQHDSIGPFGEIPAKGNGGQRFLAGQADPGDDRDPEAQLDIPLDHLPASGHQHHAVGQVVLAKDEIGHPPGRQVLGRKDKGVLGNVLEGDSRQPGEGVVQRRDQHRLEGEGWLISNVNWHVDQRPDHEINRVVSQQLEALAAGDVLEPELHPRVAPGEFADDLRQDVEDRCFAGSDVEPPGHQPVPAAQGRGERIDPLDQGTRQIVERLTVRCELDLRAAALEQRGLEFLLQRLDLQRDRGLAERAEFGRLGDAPKLGCDAEAAQVVQLVAPAFSARRERRHRQISEAMVDRCVDLINSVNT